MGLISKIKGIFKNQTLTDIVESAVENPLYISEESSMRISAVYACVRLIAEDVASLPFQLFKKHERGKEKADEHSLYYLIHDSPNADMTAFAFIEAMMTNLLLWGNSYAQIIRNKRGEVHSLVPLLSSRMQVLKDENGNYIFQYCDSKGFIHQLKKSEILHISGISYDGILGLSPITVARQAIILAKQTETYANNFFANGARPGGILQHPGIVKNPELVRKSWEAVYKGVNNAHKVCVLEEGMQYKEVSIPQKDAQFLETRQFQLNEICRIFRVPPHLVGDLTRSTFANIEHQSIDYVVHTLRPWLVRIEQAVNMQLLSDKERLQYFSKFNVDGLLRGDFATRMQGYATGIQNGFLTPNDVRALEEMNPVENGDILMVNGNMKSLDQVKEGENSEVL